ncbi:MFS transporter [Streptomyces sp. KL116D]|uniref:MFS transporter n=1 Tax=Streptomyces sp. KL116D TaxID=3045152 RepID=UPI003556AABA
MRVRLGRDFGWLWAAYTASTAGTWLALDAFQLIAVLVLHSGAAQVSFLAAAGLAMGALVAVPLGPWVEFRHKRPVMIGADLVRCAALLSLPAAFALGALSFGHLVVVSVVVAASDIAFKAASGAYLKQLLGGERLLVANGRFESTQWTATAVGPPLGGALISAFGPLTTVVLDAASYVLSALGLRAIRTPEQPPAPPAARGALGLGEGWRHILGHPVLRPLFLNTVLVNGLIMVGAPLVAVLMLGDLGFAPWQYGLAFGLPCLGGLVGSRLARPLAARFGQLRVLWVSAVARVVWPVGLAFVGPGAGGLALVVVIELGLITCCGVFNPVYATYRLQQTEPGTVARVLTAWSVTGSATTATLTLAWGGLAALVGIRPALAAAGVLLLATPLLLRPLAGGRAAAERLAPPVDRV